MESGSACSATSSRNRSRSRAVVAGPPRARGRRDRRADGLPGRRPGRHAHGSGGRRPPGRRRVRLQRRATAPRRRCRDGRPVGSGVGRVAPRNRRPPRGNRPDMRAIIVADGDPPSTAALDATWPGWRDGTELVVAADGGARAARDAGFVIDLIVGDGDSLGDAGLAEFAAAGVSVERSPPDKDESDTELAVLACLARGATSIAIIGAFGGRAGPHPRERLVACAAGARGPSCRTARRPDAHHAPSRARARRLPATASLSGRAGDIVTLLPLGERVEGSRLKGFATAFAMSRCAWARPGASRTSANGRRRRSPRDADCS